MNIDVRLELSELAEARQQIGEITAIAERTPEVALERIRAWRAELAGFADVPGELGGLVALAGILEQLLAWGAAVRAAETDAERYLNAAKAQTHLRLRDLTAAGDAYETAVTSFLAATRDLANYADLQGVADRFARIPLRSSLTRRKAEPSGRERSERRHEDASALPVIDLAVAIDGEPWIGPRMLRLNQAHKVTLSARLSHRPAQMQSVTVSGISSLGADVLRWHEVTFNADEFSPTATREVTIVGRATTNFATRHEVRLSARLRAGEHDTPLTTIGIRTVRPVITDLVVPTMGAGTVPLQFYELLRDVQGRALRPDPEHWNDFEQLLAASLAFQLSSLAGGEYRDTANRHEREFQADVRTFLRARLGPDDVYEGEKAGGGEFDLRYRSVPNELKVERVTSSLAAIAYKYSAQASQYAAVRGRQLAILTVLDVTEKREHLGHVANYVRVIERTPAAASGLERPIPLITVLVVIAAHYPRPSDLS